MFTFSTTEKAHQKEHQEHNEQNLRDMRGSPGQCGETQQSRDQAENQKPQNPVQHVRSPFMLERNFKRLLSKEQAEAIQVVWISIGARH